MVFKIQYSLQSIFYRLQVRTVVLGKNFETLLLVIIYNSNKFDF